jgi:aminoglycoside phosphotransferase
LHHSYTLKQASKTWPKLEWRLLASLLLDKWAAQSIDKYTVMPLEGGHSRDMLFTLSIDGQDCVLRMVPKDREGGELVAVLSTIASEAGIAPKVFFNAPDAKIILMDKMPGQTVKIRELKIKEGIVALSNGLRQIHQLPLTDEVKPERLFATIYQWQDNQTDYPFLKTGIFQAALTQYDALTAFDKDKIVERCLLHGDINPSNIFLDNKKCYFIDWEFAGIGSPILELARTCEWFDYDTQEETLFLKAYFEGDVPENIKLSVKDKRLTTYLDMFWLCLSFLPKDLISEDKLMKLIETTPALSLNKMAMDIEKKLVRQTDNEAILIEAVGFLNHFVEQSRSYKRL